MAKKSFNISSTLAKNKESQLAKKIPLKKNLKDDAAVQEKVAKIHAEEKPVVKEKKSENANKPVAKKVKKATAASSEKLVRLTIDTPVGMHKKLKIRSIEKGISMRDYILELIYKELN